MVSHIGQPLLEEDFQYLKTDLESISLLSKANIPWFNQLFIHPSAYVILGQPH